MPAHTILSSGTVVIGASADPSDLIEAMRAAARGNRTIRLHAVDSLDTLAPYFPGCHRPVVLDEQRRRHNCDCTKTALKAAATSD